MSPAKVTLSPKERELVNDAGFILTKNAIIQKVCILFGGLSEIYRIALQDPVYLSWKDAGDRGPKISKGEQYRGLPWVMLDYPRQFTTNDVFSIRSFFWWGNFCSITLQLSGSYLLKYSSSIQQYFLLNGLPSRGAEDWYICSGTNPWEHHFEKDNYEPLSKSRMDEIHRMPFIKLSKKISLSEWDQLEDFYVQHFNQLLAMLSS